MPLDLINDTAVDLLQTPASALTADTNCTSVDLQGYRGCLLVACVATSGDAASLSTTNMIELEVEESTDDSTFTDVADADLIGYVDGTNDGTFAVIDGAADDNACYEVQYIGDKRYVRPVVSFSGQHTNGTTISIAAIKLDPTYKPQT